MIRKTLTILKSYWWAIIILVVSAWLVYIGVNCHLWINSIYTGFQGKTIWVVLELVIIPVTLGLITYILDKRER